MFWTKGTNVALRFNEPKRRNYFNLKLGIIIPLMIFRICLLNLQLLWAERFVQMYIKIVSVIWIAV